MTGRPDLKLEEPESSAPTPIDIAAPGEYMQQLTLAYHVAQFIRAMPLRDMINAISLAESVAPIMAPDLFREKSRAMSQDKQILEILSFAQRKLNGVRSEQR